MILIVGMVKRMRWSAVAERIQWVCIRVGALPEIWADNVQGGEENGSTRWGKRGDNWTAMGAEIGGQGGRRSGMPMRGIIAGLINGGARTTDRCSPGRCAAPFPLLLTPRPCVPSLAHFHPLATMRSLQSD